MSGADAAGGDEFIDTAIFRTWSVKQLSRTIATRCEVGADWWNFARSRQCPARDAKAMDASARAVCVLSSSSESEVGGVGVV